MKINKGDTLEEISLPTPDGSIFNLSETKGKKVLLTFCLLYTSDAADDL